MWKNVSRRAGKRAISSFIVGAMISTGTVAVTAPIAVADPAATAQTATSEPTKSVTGHVPKGEKEGIGQGTLSAGSVEPGGLLTFRGEGFVDRSSVQDAFFGIKINDGEIKFTPDQDGASEGDVDGAGTFNLSGDLPGPDGNFEAKVRIPKDLVPGAYSLRVLAGNDGGDRVSKYVWFFVTGDDNKPGDDAENPAETQLQATAVSGTAVDVLARGFEAGEEISATVAGTPVQFREGRKKVDTLVASEDGSLKAFLSLTTGTLPAGTSGEVVLTGKKTGAEAKSEITGVPDVSFRTKFGSTPALGSTAEVSIENLADDTELVGLGAGETNFVKDLPKKKSSAGKITLSDVKIPNDAELRGKNVYADLVLPGAAKSTHFETPVKVTPDNSVKNAENFELKSVDLPSGLYQTAYSAKQNSIFVTRSVGRPPLKESTLFKVNADTLKVEKEITPAAGSAETGLYGVYGIDVDDARDRVWVTNTRQNTVSVYNTTDMSLLHRFEDGSVNHSRDVQVDPKTGLAYVSSPRGGGSKIEVFDLDNKTHSTIDLSGENFGGTMSLDFDEKSGELFTVSFDAPKAAKIDVRNGNKVTVYDLGEGKLEAGSGIAWDSANRNLHIVGQGSANDLVYNIDKKEVVANIPTGAGALNADYNAASGLVYVSNFGADTVTVIDAKSLKVVGNLSLAGSVNHVQSGKGGNVYAVTKTAIDKDGKSFNKLVKIAKKGSTPGGGSSSLGNGTIQTITRVVVGLASALGIVVAASGLLKFAVGHGIIPRHLIPAPLQKYL